MKIWLKNVTVAKVYNLSPKHQKKVVDIVEENKDLLLSEWRNYHE